MGALISMFNSTLNFDRYSNFLVENHESSDAYLIQKADQYLILMLAPSGDRLIYERVINGTVCARHTYIFSFGSVYLAKDQRSGPQRWYGSPIHDRMALPFSNNRSRFTLDSVLILCTCMQCATQNGFGYTGPRV